MDRLKLITLVTALTLNANSCFARPTLHTQEFTVDFLNIKSATENSSWSGLDLLPDGLGWEFKANGVRDIEIRTNPIPMGFAWRAPRSVRIRVGISAEKNGRKWEGYPVGVYARYSTDFEHWSSWMPLAGSEPKSVRENGIYFEGLLSVTRLERNGFYSFLRKFSRQDVPWTSDEAAAAEWIAKLNPEYFSTHVPVIGYIQILFEGTLLPGVRIRSLESRFDYSISGMTVPPKDRKSFKRPEGSWSFGKK